MKSNFNNFGSNPNIAPNIENGLRHVVKCNQLQPLRTPQAKKPMSTHCTSNSVEFQAFFSRKVTARFDGGRLTSDAGALLLREVEHKINVFERLAECFTD